MGALARWTMLRVRLYRPDRNPLRRGTDKLEAFAMLVCLLLLARALVLASVIGHLVYQNGMAAERSGHWVTARLLDDAPAVLWVSSEGQGVEPRAEVTWTAADGRIMTGEAPVSHGLMAGVRRRKAAGTPAVRTAAGSGPARAEAGTAKAVTHPYDPYVSG